MTTFEIDAGSPQVADTLAARQAAWVRDFAPSWFLDAYPSDPDPVRAIHDYAYHLIGHMNEPKTMTTVRKHVVAQWPYLRLLAETWPDVFDEFWSAYSERWQGLQ